MGEVHTDIKNGGKGIVKKSRKLSTRVDLTPVVDLAFLLLTFFLLTTTFIKPQVMALILPEKNDESSRPKVYEERVMSLILGEDNKIYWYIGITAPEVRETDYSAAGIREVLLEHNKKIEKMVVLIKPDNTSTYENLVDILDELEIADIERYALVELEAEDQIIMQRYYSEYEGRMTMKLPTASGGVLSGIAT